MHVHKILQVDKTECAFPGDISLMTSLLLKSSMQTSCETSEDMAVTFLSKNNMSILSLNLIIR